MDSSERDLIPGSGATIDDIAAVIGTDLSLVAGLAEEVGCLAGQPVNMRPKRHGLPHMPARLAAKRL